MNIGFTPVNQVRLTNVAYVRLQKKGKRFEIACYRNKVLNWRNKIETDIGEVLQVDTVFTNVSKGLLASSKDLVEVFGTADQRLVCQEILDKGELQVSEQERGALYESVFRDVASIVADKTVNPENNRPYTVSMIQNAMKQIQYSVNVSKNSKSQALDVIRKLRDVMPIVRANMLLRVICLQEEVEPIREEVVSSGAVVVSTDATSSTSSSASANNVNRFIELRIDPELFRKVEEIVSEKTGGVGRVEVVQLRVANSQPSTAAVTTSSTANASASVATAAQEDSSNKKVKAVEDGPAAGGGGSAAGAATTKGKGKGSTSAMSRQNKSRQRAQELAMLAAVNSQEVDSEDVDEDQKEYDMLNDLGDEEDIETLGIAKNSNRKKNKQKKQIAAALEISDDEEESHSESDVQLAVPITAAVTAVDVGATGLGDVVHVQGIEDPHHGPAGDRKPAHVNKKGKKNKRLEKEELKEREKKALALKQRISAQNSAQHVPLAVEYVGASLSEAAPTAAAVVNAEGAAGSGAVPSQSAEASVLVSDAHVRIATDAKAQSCNTCGGQFFDVKDYRNHFRSEWHRHNLSRKLKNKPLVKSEEEFLALTLEELDL